MTEYKESYLSPFTIDLRVLTDQFRKGGLLRENECVHYIEKKNIDDEVLLHVVVYSTDPLDCEVPKPLSDVLSQSE